MERWGVRRFKSGSRPRRFRRRDDVQLFTDRLKVYAYQGYCECGWSGPNRDTSTEARADAREHARTEHPDRPTREL